MHELGSGKRSLTEGLIPFTNWSVLMKTTILSLVLVSIAGLMYFSDESLAVTQEPEDKELQTLMETRRDTLKEVVRLADVRSQTGTITANELLMAQTALLEAELELAKSQQERIAILEKMLDNSFELHTGRGPNKEKTTSTQVRDMALATLIEMTHQDPLTYGLPFFHRDNSGNIQTVGVAFESDQKRDAAFEQWRVWSSQNLKKYWQLPQNAEEGTSL